MTLQHDLSSVLSRAGVPGWEIEKSVAYFRSDVRIENLAVLHKTILLFPA